MFSTLKKLGHKRKFHRKGKDKKTREALSGTDKLKSTARSSVDLCGDAMPHFDPSRRHSCFSAFIDVPTEMLRRGSNASQGSTCAGGAKGRRGSTASTASTGSAESYRVRRLAEIAQIDRYVENLKKSADSDNLSYLPNRLCVALLLKSVLQRRERQYMYDFLHSNRCSSESDVSMKSQRDVDLTLSDENNNNNDNNNSNSNIAANRLKQNSHAARSKRDDYCHEFDSKSIDTSEEGDVEGDSIDSKGNQTPKEREPGALLKAYQLEFSERSADSDSEIIDGGSRHRRYRKRSDSKTRRKSVALFPKNYEIY